LVDGLPKRWHCTLRRLQLVTATLAGREGQFVLETTGDFDGTTAKWEASVIPGSATRHLEGLSGWGTFGAPHGPRAAFDFAYDFE
jgi:hypothetical protein